MVLSICGAGDDFGVLEIAFRLLAIRYLFPSLTKSTTSLFCVATVQHFLRHLHCWVGQMQFLSNCLPNSFEMGSGEVLWHRLRRWGLTPTADVICIDTGFVGGDRLGNTAVEVRSWRRALVFCNADRIGPPCGWEGFQPRRIYSSRTNLPITAMLHTRWVATALMAATGVSVVSWDCGPGSNGVSYIYGT